MADEQTKPYVAPYEDDNSPDAVEARRVAKLAKELKAARAFDEPQRKQYAIDRAYAAGTADTTWASDANLIGSFVDILVSFLYAQDPDVDVRPAEQVGSGVAMDGPELAQTLRLVVMKLWKRGRLKHAVKKMVRSALSIGPGWIKVLLLSETKENPEIAHALNDLRDNLARIRAKRRELEEGGVEDIEVAEAELESQIAGLEAEVEVVIRQGLAIDFVPADHIQISLDVAETSDYLEANWISHDLYVPRDELCQRFPALTKEDVKQSAVYYQQRPASAKDGEFNSSMAEAGESAAFSKQRPESIGEGDDPVEFARISEIWDKRDNQIKTVVEGIKKWARAPYAPPYAASRFYPFFRLAFFEVDGARHPQSLSWRLRKLQDEYSTTRSNGRLVRERSVPGVIFNAAQITPEDAKKVTDSVTAEFTGIKPTSPDANLNHAFISKPVPSIAPGLYDTSPILRDMERISGVQDALQSSIVTPKTATEAQIQQSGFASRTNADRDALEDVLGELALYTAEVALQGLDLAYARKCAGPGAFWPEGMDIEDILTLVEVDIDAGSTGRPNLAADREAWGVIMPMMREMVVQIRMLQMQDPPLAEAMSALLRETARRLDDRMDVDAFIPPPMPQQPGMAPGGPAMPPEMPPGGEIPAGGAAAPMPEEAMPAGPPPIV